MKLRNKETGEIEKVYIVTDGDKIVVIVADMPLCGNSVLGEYETLAEFNEKWEDYTPAEPLFTEKLAQTFRYWAEINELSEVRCQHIDDTKASFVGWREPDVRGIEIDIPKTHMSMRVNVGEIYTIDELCGEEEE